MGSLCVGMAACDVWIGRSEPAPLAGLSTLNRGLHASMPYGDIDIVDISSGRPMGKMEWRNWRHGLPSSPHPHVLVERDKLLAMQDELKRSRAKQKELKEQADAAES